MSQFEKLLAKFLSYPEGLNYTKIVKIFKKEGFTGKQDGTSHYSMYYEGRHYTGFIIHDGDCKPFYKKKALKNYLKFKEEQEKQEENEKEE